MNKLKLFWDLFREGECVSDPTKWKTHAISINQLAAIICTLVAIVGSFGYKIDISTDTALAIGGGILALVNWVFTIITSDKVGILPAKPVTPLPPAYLPEQSV